MTPAELKALCRAIWGKGWAAELSAALSVHPVTVRRWACGMESIPDEREATLLKQSTKWSLERHRNVSRIAKILKNPYKISKKDRELKVSSSVVIQPWKKFKKRYMIIDDF